MKKKLLLILIYLISTITYSQVTHKDNNKQTLVDGRYIMTETKTFDKTKYALPADVKIEKDDYVVIIGEEGDNITFKNVTPTILEEAEEDARKKAKIYVTDKATNVKEAKDAAEAELIKVKAYVNKITDAKTLPKSLFFYYARQQFKIYKGAGVGLYTVPFKLRPGKNFDFEAALSLSTNIVFGFGNKDSTESFLDASVGIGVTSISLTEDNSTVTENRTATALTLSAGSVIKFSNNANIGLFFGGDFLNSNDSKTDWIHNKNLWIGVGINVTFSKIETNKQSKKSEEYNKKMKEKFSLEQ